MTRRQRARWTTRSWSDGGKLKIFSTPRNLLNDMARRQRAKEDKKRAIALHKKSHTEPLAKDSVKGYDPEQQKKRRYGKIGSLRQEREEKGENLWRSRILFMWKRRKKENIFLQRRRKME